jgi:valyl-tRNA synthetase
MKRTNVIVGIETPDAAMKLDILEQTRAFNASKGWTEELRLESVTANRVQLPFDGGLGILDLGPDFDLAAEAARLSKAAAAAEKERDSLAVRLANPSFVERAKPEAVEKARADHQAKVAEAERLRTALERLG